MVKVVLALARDILAAKGAPAMLGFHESAKLGGSYCRNAGPSFESPPPVLLRPAIFGVGRFIPLESLPHFFRMGRPISLFFFPAVFGVCCQIFLAAFPLFLRVRQAPCLPLLPLFTHFFRMVFAPLLPLCALPL
jgi:hypothetical protein